MSAKLPDLPTNDDEYWKDAVVSRHSPKSVKLCPDHGRKTWDKHEGYIDNKDGSISCMYCPWGTKVPGYIKVMDGKAIDLRRKHSD